MPQYCTVFHRVDSVKIDGEDTGRDPERVPVTGTIVFTPLLAQGDSVVITENGAESTLNIEPVTAQIQQGQLMHRGELGVKLFAGGEDSNPERIRWRATFQHLVAGTTQVTLKDVMFEAIPGGELALSIAQPVPGAPYPGYSATIEAGISQIESARDEAIGQVEEAVNNELGTAVQKAQDVAASAENKVDSYTPRVVALEAMAGLTPQSPIDGQTANLVNQSTSLTNAAVTTVAVPRVTTAAQETATLGPELVTSTGWTFGAGWSGNFADGFTKTAGGVGTLRWTPNFTVGTDVYLVEWKWEGTATHQDIYSGYDVYFGGGYAGITYQGAAPANQAYSRAVKAVEERGFELVPWEGFEGRIYSISVRKVLSAAAVGVGWRNSAGNRGGELRFGDAQANSVYLGIDSGKWNTTGNRNAAVGDYAMANNVTGFFNAALGFEALSLNINGTRNVAVGYRALRENVAGDRNVGIGPFALTRLTTGQRNVAIGTDTLWRLTDGNDNVGIGYLTQTELRRGSENVAIGRYAMRHTHGGAGGGTLHNIAIGTEALGYVTGSMNIGIGRRALANVTSTAQGSVAVGDLALEATTANQNTAVGKESLRYVTGGRNTAIGWNSGKGVSGQSTGTRNVFVGDNAGIGITTGSQNTVVGPSAGSNITTQTGNVLIGFGVVGLSGRDNYLNIGGVIMGDLSTQQIGIGLTNPTARLHLKTSTGAAGTAPIKIDGGTLLTTPEVGALEFAGGKLYFTTSTGNRREIAFVTT